LAIFILQYFFTSTSIIDVSGSSCDVDFAPWFIQLINISFLIILPTCINIPVLLMIIQHVRSSQNTVRSVRRIHQRLTIQFAILYAMWLLFFLPEVLFMLSIGTLDAQNWISKLFDVAAILFDALVITSFDRRFIDAWKKSIEGLMLVFVKPPVHRRIHPTI
jgi:hypothetical protein